MHGVVSPPSADRHMGWAAGGWWHQQDERIVCDLCPRFCVLKDGDRGFCFVRQNQNGHVVLTVYGLGTNFCIDPTEKKPLLFYFDPGSSLLSFGTVGCNLGCKFCERWSIAKARDDFHGTQQAPPQLIVEAARQTGCRGVAFMFNDSVTWAEYVIDTARACHHQGLKTVAVTAGYIRAEARPPFFENIDAANVDLMGLTDRCCCHSGTKLAGYFSAEPELWDSRRIRFDATEFFRTTN